VKVSKLFAVLITIKKIGNRWDRGASLLVSDLLKKWMHGVACLPGHFFEKDFKHGFHKADRFMIASHTVVDSIRSWLF